MKHVLHSTTSVAPGSYTLFLRLTKEKEKKREKEKKEKGKRKRRRRRKKQSRTIFFCARVSRPLLGTWLAFDRRKQEASVLWAFFFLSFVLWFFGFTLLRDNCLSLAVTCPQEEETCNDSLILDNEDARTKNHNYLLFKLHPPPPPSFFRDSTSAFLPCSHIGPKAKRLPPLPPQMPGS